MRRLKDYHGSELNFLFLREQFLHIWNKKETLLAGFLDYRKGKSSDGAWACGSMVALA